VELNKQQINGLIEAQYHYFESREPDKAAQVVEFLMEPMYNVGRYAELLQILEKTINTVEQLKSEFFIFHARSLSELGRHEQALAEIAVVELEVGDDPEKRAAILIDRANFMRRSGETSRADEIIGYYRQAHDIYAQQILPHVEGKGEVFRKAQSNMASCLFDEGAILQYFRKNPVAALERYGRALSIFKDVEDADGIGVVYKQMGEIYSAHWFPETYDQKHAADLFEQALTIFRENYLPRRMLETLYQIGRLFRKPYQASLEKFREYFEIAKELQLSREQAIAKRHIAELTYLLHKQEVAETFHSISKQEKEARYLSVINLAEEAARVLTVLKFDAWSQRALANCYYLMGRVYLDLGKDREALEHFHNSLNASKDTDRFSSIEDTKRRVLAVLRILQIQSSTGDRLPTEWLSQFLTDFEKLEIRLEPWPPPEDVLEQIIGQLETED
jgi:tetratricopeptide (TPR) repeat protein